MHICKGLHCHFNNQITPGLHLILREIKKAPIKHALREKTRLPITIEMLHSIQTILLKKTPSFYNITLWAMCCLAFFGFLRVREFTIPTEGSYNPSCHLSLSDIAVDNREKPCFCNCPSKNPKQICLSMVSKCMWVPLMAWYVCPIKAILAYLSRRSKRPGPLFITTEGIGWTGPMFCAGIKSLIVNLKLEERRNTHSFGFGAATSASLAKLPDAHIQILG